MAFSRRETSQFVAPPIRRDLAALMAIPVVSFALVSPATATQRMVLIEEYTNSG